MYTASVPAFHARLLGTAGPGAFISGLLLSTAVVRRTAAVLSTSLRPAHLLVCRQRRRRP